MVVETPRGGRDHFGGSISLTERSVKGKDGKTYRAGRLNAGLREIAEKEGYTPGEFAMRRFCEDGKKIQEWVDSIEAGTTHPDFMGMKPSAVRAIVRKEIDDFISRERAWADFFYPKLKSQDVAITEPVEMVIRWGDQK